MMSEPLDPRFAPLIEQLADAVQESLQGETTLTEADVIPLVRQIRDQGFAQRHRGRPLGTLVEDRVVDRYPEPAIHRREELKVLIGTIQNVWRDATDLKGTPRDRG